MIEDAQAVPGEVVVAPDPLPLSRRAVRKAWLPAVCLVVVLVVLGAAFRHSLSWGDTATWVLATTTLLAFLAAAFAGLVAYDLLKVETARDLKAAEERLLSAADRKRVEEERTARREADQRSQAGKVVAWFHAFRAFRGTVPPEVESRLVHRPLSKRQPFKVEFDVITPGRMSTESTWGAFVNNASELPVLDVRVLFYWVSDPGDGSPWTTELRYVSPDTFRVIPPGMTWNYELPKDIQAMEAECNTQVYLVAIEFTDAYGVPWRRDERGALQALGANVSDRRPDDHLSGPGRPNLLRHRQEPPVV